MSLQAMLIVAAAIFAIGLYGALARRNVIAVFMSIELMFNAVTLTLVALGRYVAPQAIALDVGLVLTGQVFAVFVIAVAAAEVALGLGIVFALYRNTESVDLTEAAQMRR
jgi:NADH-quinone oxidoreductase subunit K